MGQRIECSVNIAAPAELVWRTIQDPDRRTEWDERVVSDRLLQPGGPGKGKTFRLTYSVYGFRFWAEMEYIAWDPPRRSGVRAIGFSRLNIVQSAAGSWHVETQADGTTLYTTRVNISMKGGRLAPLLERLGVRGYFQRITSRSLLNVKRLIEAEYTRQVVTEEHRIAG